MLWAQYSEWRIIMDTSQCYSEITYQLNIKFQTAISVVYPECVAKIEYPESEHS